jgi:hypothetical protein
MSSPAPVADNAPRGIVLIRFPTVFEVTLTVTVHRPGVDPVWAGTVPPLNERVVAPGLADTEPPHELVSPTGSAILNPVCTPMRLSVQEVLVIENRLGL